MCQVFWATLASFDQAGRISNPHTMYKMKKKKKKKDVMGLSNVDKNQQM